MEAEDFFRTRIQLLNHEKLLSKKSCLRPDCKHSASIAFTLRRTIISDKCTCETALTGDAVAVPSELGQSDFLHLAAAQPSTDSRETLPMCSSRPPCYPAVGAHTLPIRGSALCCRPILWRYAISSGVGATSSQSCTSVASTLVNRANEKGVELASSVVGACAQAH